MKIVEVFEKKPTRRISRVVMVDQHEEQVIRTEVEEYVVTDQIRGLLQDFVNQFLETRMGRASDICTWISGFFGSTANEEIRRLEKPMSIGRHDFP